MKKVFRFWSILVLMTMCVGFSSCSKDDDEAGDNDRSLIGTWEAIEGFLQYNGVWVSEYKYKAAECIWTFNNTYLIIQNEDDIANGQRVIYSYDPNKKELTATYNPSKGETTLIVVINVLKLTSTDLELSTSFAGEKSKTVFKKIQ